MEIQQLEFLKHILRFNRRVYLDHNATTPVSARVRDKMVRALKYNFGNPSSFYGIGRKSAELMELARGQVADAIHADPSEILFTGCATESNNAVLKSVSAKCYPNRKKIISTPIEHPSVLNTLAYLETQGLVVEYCPVDDQGRLLLAELEKRIDDQTFLVCCMLANNETGVIQDIPAVTKIARQHGALVLSDCAQALGKIPIDVHAWGVDYASFSAHTLRAEGRWRTVCQTRQSVVFLTPWRSSGKRTAGWHRKPAQYRRIWRRLSGCEPTADSCRIDACLETAVD